MTPFSSIYVENELRLKNMAWLMEKLSGLAYCQHIMPGNVVMNIASNLIGERHDREEWFRYFSDQCMKAHEERQA